MPWSHKYKIAFILYIVCIYIVYGRFSRGASGHLAPVFLKQNFNLFTKRSIKLFIELNLEAENGG